MKLNEIFTEWKTGGGIFSLMVNPPWEDSITGLELDIEYFTNQSGTKQPSLLLLNFIEDNKISQNDVLTISNLLLNRFGRNWTKLWNTLLLEYNPINNYDMEEKENLVIDEIINNSGESSNSSEIDSNRYAFDSETPTPTEGQRQTNSNEFSDNGTRNNTHVRELTRKGNIGVTTSQQMITAERDLWVWDFFKTVFKDVDSVLTVPIFSLDYCKKTYEYVNGNDSDTEKYTLPVATTLSLGGVKADPKTEGDTVPVHIDSNGFLFVPTYTGVDSEYTLPVATTISLGGVKADPKTEGDTVPVHIDSNGFLFVPTYTGGGSEYTLPVATTLSLGGVKADPKTEGDTVPVHIDSNGFLFVPTYTGGGSGDNEKIFELPDSFITTLFSETGSGNLDSETGDSIFNNIDKNFVINTIIDGVIEVRCFVSHYKVNNTLYICFPLVTDGTAINFFIVALGYLESTGYIFTTNNKTL